MSLLVRFDLLIERTNLKWSIKVKSVSAVAGTEGGVVVLMCGTTLHQRREREERRGGVPGNPNKM